MTRRNELLQILVDYASNVHGSLPSQRQCRIICEEAGYVMCRATFERHFDKLRIEGKLSVDARTGAVYIPDSEWKYNGEIN